MLYAVCVREFLLLCYACKVVCPGALLPGKIELSQATSASVSQVVTDNRQQCTTLS